MKIFSLNIIKSFIAILLVYHNEKATGIKLKGLNEDMSALDN